MFTLKSTNTVCIQLILCMLFASVVNLTSGSGGVILMSLVPLGCTPNITGSSPCVCSNVSAAAGLLLLPSNMPTSSAPSRSLLTYKQQYI
jgi:hypothetical protein